MDKSLNGIQRESFDRYLVYMTFERNHTSDITDIPITIDPAGSKNEPYILAVDFIAGALHNFYRTDDDTYSKIIRGKIALAFDYFKGPQK